MVKTVVPICFRSDPSYQSQAENDCFTCDFSKDCLIRGVMTTETMTPAKFKELYEQVPTPQTTQQEDDMKIEVDKTYKDGSDGEWFVHSRSEVETDSYPMKARNSFMEERTYTEDGRFQSNTEITSSLDLVEEVPQQVHTSGYLQHEEPTTYPAPASGVVTSVRTNAEFGLGDQVSVVVTKAQDGPADEHARPLDVGLGVAEGPTMGPVPTDMPVLNDLLTKFASDLRSYESSQGVVIELTRFNSCGDHISVKVNKKF